MNFPNNEVNAFRCEGGTTATFTVKGTGGAGLSGTLTAHWQYSVNGNPPWIDIPNPVFTSTNGNVIATLTVDQTQFGNFYRIAVDNNGCVSYSPAGGVITNPTPTINPVNSQVVCHLQPTQAVSFSGTQVTS